MTTLRNRSFSSVRHLVQRVKAREPCGRVLASRIDRSAVRERGPVRLPAEHLYERCDWRSLRRSTANCREDGAGGFALKSANLYGGSGKRPSKFRKHGGGKTVLNQA
jgi:hypothetical protein